MMPTRSTLDAQKRSPVTSEAGSDTVSFADNAVAAITAATTGVLGSLQDVLDKLAGAAPAPAPSAPETPNAVEAPSVPEAPSASEKPVVPELPSEAQAAPSKPVEPGLKWAEGGETGRVAVNQGTDGNDLLMFKSGTLAGGLGDDKYIVSNIEAAKVVEKAGGGIDTIVATSRYMVMPDHTENLEISGTEGAVGIGNDGDNIIRGNAGDDLLIGGAGNNLLSGGAGNDIFLVGKADAVTRITDFSAGDIIHMAGDEFASFGALKAAMQQVGQDTVVNLSGGRQIILDNRDMNSLTATDFDMQDAGSAAKGANATYKVSLDKQLNSFVGAETNDKLSGNGAAILRGDLKPGAKINLDRLRQDFAVSISPLREAVSRLVPDGLVEFEDQRGYRVAPVSAASAYSASLWAVRWAPRALSISAR